MFEDARDALLISNPFFGYLLMKFKHVPDKQLQPPTACISGTEIRYNPAFFEQLTLQQGVFVVAHEVLHAALMHVERLRKYNDHRIGPNGKPFDLNKYLLAIDYVVNATLVAESIGDPIPDNVMARICGNPNATIALDTVRFPASMTPEEVYCILYDEVPHSDAESFDSHDADGEESVLQIDDVMVASKIAKVMHASVPGCVERTISEFKRPNTSPWKRLRHFVSSCFSGYDRTSWRRFQRRAITRGIGMPGRVASSAGSIGIVIDTSGSIDQNTLDCFAGHIGAIMDDTRPRSVTLYWTDTAVRRTDVVKSSAQLHAVMSGTIPGGGGTNMPEGIKAAEAKSPDLIIVLTDGDTPFGSKPRVPVLWVMTDTQRKAPYGEHIYVNV